MIDHHTWTTHSAKTSEVTPVWFLVDASGLTLGRLATRIAMVLQGKHKPCYTAHVDTGDFVVVINAEKVVLTGRKLDQKKYYAYSGYPGGLRTTTARKMLDIHPERVLEAAVQGMVPGTRLGRVMLTKLKVYAGGTHPHAAQQPSPFPDHL